MEEKKTDKKALVVAIALVLVFLATGTFAWLRIGATGSKVNKIKAGSLVLELDEAATDGIRLEHEVPKSYQQGIRNQSYSFILKSNSTVATDYEITLEDFYEGSDVSAPKIADKDIRYALVKNDIELLPTNTKLLSTGRVIDSGTIAGKSGNTPATITYTLYVWIDSMAGDDGTETSIMDKIFNARLNVSAEQHHEATPVALQRDIWTTTSNALCIKTLNGDKCFNSTDSYDVIKASLGETFGTTNCTESSLGPTGTMYNCNPIHQNGDPYDYAACYVQSFSDTGRKYLSCTLPEEYSYDNKLGTLSCSTASDGTGGHTVDNEHFDCSFNENGSATTYNVNHIK